MRLEQFINEGRHTEITFDTDNNEEKIIKMAKLLFKDCKPYLKDLGKSGDVMYRGAKGGDMTKIIPRKDRVPKDMDPNLSNMIDGEFYSKYKWYPRSEGVFCSGSRGQAKAYGSVYTVWPIGKYNFLWSSEIYDLYNHFDNYNSDNIDTDVFYEEWLDEYGEGCDGTWYYDGNDTEENDKDDAEEIVIEWIKKKHEDEDDEDDEEFDPYDEFDSIEFKWMPGVPEDEFIEDRIEQETERMEDEKNDIIGEYNDKDMRAAIHSENEIMVGCSSYYLIDDKFTIDLNKIVSKGKIKPVHKQLKFQFAYKKRRPKK